MKITKLSLRDFRGFGSLDLDLSPDATALVGVNGAGKTSILDAIAIALAQLVLGILGRDPEDLPLEAKDVRLGASTACVTLSAEIEGKAFTWQWAKTLPGRRPTASNATEDCARSLRRCGSR